MVFNSLRTTLNAVKHTKTLTKKSPQRHHNSYLCNKYRKANEANKEDQPDKVQLRTRCIQSFIFNRNNYLIKKLLYKHIYIKSWY